MRETMKNFLSEENEGNGSLNSVAKIAIGAIVGVVALITLFGSVYFLNEDQDAVITTFGVPSVVEESGPHFKIPFIQGKNKVNMGMRKMSIGYNPETGESVENESLMITKDMNFVAVDFDVEWQVTDAIKFLYASEDAELVLRTLAMSYIRDTVGSYNIDNVLTTEKAQIQSEIREKLITRLEAEDIGVTVRTVALQDAEPPTDAVASAFLDVENAKQKAEETVNNANKYRNEQLPAAEASAASILEKAAAAKATRIAEANGQIARFNAMYEEYIKFPEITKSRMYYETMEELLPNLKVIIQGADGEIVNIIGADELKSAE